MEHYFYRELGHLFSVPLAPHNRWASAKALREKWLHHIENSLYRPVLLIEEALETKHWSHAAFYPPVILFDDVVQVGTISNLDGTVPTVMEFVIHTMRRKAAWVASKPSRVITFGSPWRLRALRKKALAAVTSRVRLSRIRRFCLVYQQRGRGTSIDRLS